MTAPQWRFDALCAHVDPDIFFPDKGCKVDEAKRICAQCPVRAECLEFALENGERDGVWGGLSPRERRKIRVRPQPPSRDHGTRQRFNEGCRCDACVDNRYRSRRHLDVGFLPTLNRAV